MPASTSRTPWRTFSGVSRLMRPSSSSSPQSPQVEPGGRCFHRFVTISSPSGRGHERPALQRCLYRPVGLDFGRRVPRARPADHPVDRDLASQRRKVTTMTEKQLVVSADGHILEPTDLFVTRLPKHLRDRAVWEDDFEIEPLVEGGARMFRRLHTPGFEGWTISRYRQTGGRMPEGDPEMIIEDLDVRRRRRRGDASEPVALRPLLRRPRAVHGACPRLQRLHHRAVHAVLLAPGTHGSHSPHRHRRCRGRDRAGRRRRLPGDPAAGGAAQALLLTGLRPRVGGGAGQRRARVHPHPDRRGQGQRPGVAPRSRSSWRTPHRSTSR